MPDISRGIPPGFTAKGPKRQYGIFKNPKDFRSLDGPDRTHGRSSRPIYEKSFIALVVVFDGFSDGLFPGVFTGDAGTGG